MFDKNSIITSKKFKESCDLVFSEVINIDEFELSKVNAVKKAAEDGSPGTVILIGFKNCFPITLINFFTFFGVIYCCISDSKSKQFLYKSFSNSCKI